MLRPVLTAYGRECLRRRTTPEAPTLDRPTLFSVALRAAGLTMAGFIDAYLDEPAAEGVVYAVLAGRKTSGRISAAIDRLIADQKPRIERGFSQFRAAA
jgi:hypothetical protein